ncbi:hypothetical protein SISNIDRAFT_460504 [Sistotremastrum niveocremeum HHB9708]|uniref:Uncharacterized protein n=1 Tax=Sistotremastrum niveocremeum HHB9708 TaxID=1314777 RepID=A0A164NIX9_9AGAM|nr:hypothetical protein SISNIDRAFT_460504 [Sistotremastrum niveocremeum HHB9708]
MSQNTDDTTLTSSQQSSQRTHVSQPPRSYTPVIDQWKAHSTLTKQILREYYDSIGQRVPRKNEKAEIFNRVVGHEAQGYNMERMTQWFHRYHTQRRKASGIQGGGFRLADNGTPKVSATEKIMLPHFTDYDFQQLYMLKSCEPVVTDGLIEIWADHIKRTKEDVAKWYRYTQVIDQISAGQIDPPASSSAAPERVAFNEVSHHLPTPTPSEFSPPPKPLLFSRLDWQHPAETHDSPALSDTTTLKQEAVSPLVPKNIPLPSVPPRAASTSRLPPSSNEAPPIAFLPEATDKPDAQHDELGSQRMELTPSFASSPAPSGPSAPSSPRLVASTIDPSSRHVVRPALLPSHASAPVLPTLSTDSGDMNTPRTKRAHHIQTIKLEEAAHNLWSPPLTPSSSTTRRNYMQAGSKDDPICVETPPSSPEKQVQDIEITDPSQPGKVEPDIIEMEISARLPRSNEPIVIEDTPPPEEPNIHPRPDSPMMIDDDEPSTQPTTLPPAPPPLNTSRTQSQVLDSQTLPSHQETDTLGLSDLRPWPVLQRAMTPIDLTSPPSSTSQLEDVGPSRQEGNEMPDPHRKDSPVIATEPRRQADKASENNPIVTESEERQTGDGQHMELDRPGVQRTPEEGEILDISSSVEEGQITEVRSAPQTLETAGESAAAATQTSVEGSSASTGHRPPALDLSLQRSSSSTAPASLPRLSTENLPLHSPALSTGSSSCSKHMHESRFRPAYGIHSSDAASNPPLVSPTTSSRPPTISKLTSAVSWRTIPGSSPPDSPIEENRGSSPIPPAPALEESYLTSIPPAPALVESNLTHPAPPSLDSRPRNPSPWTMMQSASGPLTPVSPDTHTIPTPASMVQDQINFERGRPPSRRSSYNVSSPQSGQPPLPPMSSSIHYVKSPFQAFQETVMLAYLKTDDDRLQRLQRPDQLWRSDVSKCLPDPEKLRVDNHGGHDEDQDMEDDDVVEIPKPENLGVFSLSPVTQTGLQEARDLLAALRRGELSHIGMRTAPSDEAIDVEMRAMFTKPS